MTARTSPGSKRMKRGFPRLTKREIADIVRGALMQLEDTLERTSTKPSLKQKGKR